MIKNGQVGNMLYLWFWPRHVCTYAICQDLKKCYPQALLEECRYEIKKKKKNKMENLTNDDLNPSSFDSESDNQSDNKSND